MQCSLPKNAGETATGSIRHPTAVGVGPDGWIARWDQEDKKMSSLDKERRKLEKAGFSGQTLEQAMALLELSLIHIYSIFAFLCIYCIFYAFLFNFSFFYCIFIKSGV